MWIEVSTLNEKNSLEKICSKGFEIPRNGMLFTAGDIRLDKGKLRNSEKLEFLLVKLSLGNSFCVEEKDYKASKMPSPPNGFDSLFLFKPKGEDEGFEYRYVVFQGHQALPCYLVHMELDKLKETMSKVCLCTEKAADLRALRKLQSFHLL